jgi:mannose/cellobiose epimerase-like protein (N-acyl-D-glucosamine 2-epimerase family)
VLSLEQETDRLLAFARGARVDAGFGWMDGDGAPLADRPPQLWITGRMTHVFALGTLLGRQDCAALADHGVRALAERFADPEHGGWFSELPGGRKEAYAHAFVLLAASSATIAGRPGAAALLHEAIAVIERRFWSEPEGACLESWDREWTEPEGYRGANANMHMVEAFLAAGDATGDPRWYDRAGRIAAKLIDGFARVSGWRVPEHFDAGWAPLADYNRDAPRDPFRPFGVTPGHALEWSRLLLALRAALAAPPAWLVDAARGLFARAVDEGWVEPGGFVYTTDHDGQPVAIERLHWPVTEAIGAAAVLHAVTGAEEYARWQERCWAFAEAHLIDHERGSWRHELDADLRPAGRMWQGKPDVYHAFQATLIPRLPVRPSLAGALR